MIHRGESLFVGGMDAGIYAGRMVGIRQNASLCDMIPHTLSSFFLAAHGRPLSAEALGSQDPICHVREKLCIRRG